MAASKEAVDRAEAVEKITGFAGGGASRVDLGGVGRSRLVYDVFSYQRRAVAIDGQPLVLSTTRQPVLALELVSADGRVAAYPLAYAADVQALSDDVVAEITTRLEAQRAR